MIYVDDLRSWGWRLRGHLVDSCHMFTDTLDLTDLHAMALSIGMKRAWFQDKPSAPHYDLVKSRRDLAIQLGAIPVDTHRAVAIWRTRRALVSTKFPN